ncbi:MAG: ATP-grasp domain-containing protein [Isosphaeraceae bacterium]
MDLLIVGSTARAAADSALRAGYRPSAVDLFADQDLAAIAPCVRARLDVNPRSVIVAARGLPCAPWLYTGPFENQPEILEELGATRPLLGNGPEVVRAVRDPWRVHEAWRSAGLPCPAVQGTSRGLPRDGSWLRKPLASGGGLGIALLLDRDVDDAGHYYQARCAGRPVSALYVGQGGRSTLLGLSRQLVGRRGAPFLYRGSVYPALAAARTLEVIRKIGEVLTTTFRLVGLFGVDLMLDPGGLAWPIEVNPRYTASVEVIELTTRRALLPLHVAACQGDAPPEDTAEANIHGFVGKQVVYAPGALTVDLDLFEATTRRVSPWVLPELADIPARGTPIAQGDPIATVFARGDSIRATSRALALRARWLLRALGADSTR